MAGRQIRTFTVLPQLPERLKALNDLAYNLWWCWNTDAVALFRRIDVERFEALDQSPIKLLNEIPQKRLLDLAADDGFLAHMDRVAGALAEYMGAKTWFQETYPDGKDVKIAYFSAEFGIHESVPVYSGGLGVLAGDHLKSASDLGIPLCGVSLMYREGYFRQSLNLDGWQQERYPENDFFTLPLIPELKPDGTPIIVAAPLPGREILARVWRIQVGRIPLYLLDCNIPQNRPEDRAITAQLYGGDIHTRIQQEIVLGIGGIRALHELGFDPTVCHMNEGHSAFSALERIRVMMQAKKTDFATASEAIRGGTCFTTHTPVPAGNDAFPASMMDTYFGPYIPTLGLDRIGFLNLGRERANDDTDNFSMTVLAIRLANTSNGVSKLHGVVSRKMWKGLWPGLPESEVPITSITNGVHTQTWLAPEIAHLFTRYIGVRWVDKPTDHKVWEKAEHIPDAELWRTHVLCRERLVTMSRHRLGDQLRKRGASPVEVAQAEEVLDPDALTIGFARRFATYKRGTLIFRDMPRLLRMLNNTERPVQFIFSGKAHPKDNPGKEFIAAVAQFARRNELRKKIVFVEDYDMNVARQMVQGVDVWLNNPRRPLEASGTSGMKVCCNGGLNLSVLDGWWDEGYKYDNGWAIGSGEEYTDLTYQDEVESRALYDLIELDIAPMFFKRGPDGLPREWIRRMKRSISTNVTEFNTNRMVEDYTRICYAPSHARFGELSGNDLAGAIELANWRRKLQSEWHNVSVESVDAPMADHLRVGGSMPVKAKIRLGGLTPADVEVQVFHGRMDTLGDIPNPSTFTLQTTGSSGGSVTYSGKLECDTSGQFGLCIRVLPKHRLLRHLFEPALLVWG